MTSLPRVGVLVPSGDTTLERELPQLLAGRATAHFTRMRQPDVTLAGLRAMEDHARHAATLLADIEPDVVVFGCTSGSFFRGAEHERQIAAELAGLAGAPVITAARAVAAALARRGPRVRMRTPYSDELTEAGRRYMEAAGLTVTSAAGLHLTRDADIAAVGGDALLDMAAGGDEADVLLLSCTNLPTLAMMSKVASETSLPVVTSNHAIAEAVLDELAGSCAGVAVEPADPGASRGHP